MYRCDNYVHLCLYLKDSEKVLQHEIREATYFNSEVILSLVERVFQGPPNNG